MKKLTLLAAAALVAAGANAQYTLESPYANATVNPDQAQIYDVILGSESVINGLKGAGQTVNEWMVNDVDVFLYVWDGTYAGGDSSVYPGVGYDDMQFDGYSSLTIGTVGWSGAGYFINSAKKASTKHWNDQTRFHVAYRTAATGPNAVGITIAEMDGVAAGAKFSLGEAYPDEKGAFPPVAPKISDEWQALDISFSDLKKVWAGFTYPQVDAYEGNMMTILGGGVTGQNISLDCIFFHTPSGTGAVEGVASEETSFFITANTVNAAGAQAIELYDLQGRLVKKAASSVLGIEDVPAGVYVVKAGNAVKKIVK